jgi:hypothetical protein
MFADEAERAHVERFLAAANGVLDEAALNQLGEKRRARAGVRAAQESSACARSRCLASKNGQER